MPRKLVIIICAAVGLAACAGGKQPPDNGRVCQIYGSQQSRAEVVATGTVVDVLGMRRGPSGTHEGFLLRLNGACDLLVKVETNTDLTGPVPLQPGESVEVKGEYEYNVLGGVIHWTHHDPRGRHDGGYVIAAGKMYQ